MLAVPLEHNKSLPRNQQRLCMQENNPMRVVVEDAARGNVHAAEGCAQRTLHVDHCASLPFGAQTDTNGPQHRTQVERLQYNTSCLPAFKLVEQMREGLCIVEINRPLVEVGGRRLDGYQRVQD